MPAACVVVQQVPGHERSASTNKLEVQEHCACRQLFQASSGAFAHASWAEKVGSSMGAGCDASTEQYEHVSTVPYTACEANLLQCALYLRMHDNRSAIYKRCKHVCLWRCFKAGHRKNHKYACARAQAHMTAAEAHVTVGAAELTSVKLHQESRHPLEHVDAVPPVQCARAQSFA